MNNMHKIIRAGKIVFGPIIIIALFVSLYRTSNLRIKKSFPKFSYRTIDGVSFTDKNITDKRKRNVFIRLSVGCASCDFSMRNLISNQNSLADISFFLIIHQSDSDSLQSFIDKYPPVRSLKNFMFLLDPEPLDSMTVFKSYYVPAVFVYEDERFIKKTIGDVTSESILGGSE